MTAEQKEAAPSVEKKDDQAKERVVFADPTTIQTLIFDKKKFNAAEAKAWAKEHGFKNPKVDETEDSLRLRQKDPGEFQEGSFRTIEVKPGVKAVIGRLKKSISAAELEWNEKHEKILKNQGEFVVHRLKGTDRHYVRMGTSSEESEGYAAFVTQGIEFDDPQVVEIRPGGPSWWLEKKERIGDFELESYGTYTVEENTPTLVVLEFRGDKIFKGRYSLRLESDGWTLTGPIAERFSVVKQSEEMRYTLGVAYPANQTDAHKDKISPEDLEKAAHSFIRRMYTMKDGRLPPNAGLMHQAGTDLAGEVVESYIYRGPDWDVGDQKVRAGDWLLGVIWSEDAWTNIRKGKFKGYSIQGWAIRSS